MTTTLSSGTGQARDDPELLVDGPSAGILAGIQKLYTIAEVAALTKMSQYWIREQCRERRIAHHRLGRNYRLSLSDLMQLAAETRVQAVEQSLTPTRHHRT